MKKTILLWVVMVLHIIHMLQESLGTVKKHRKEKNHE